MQRGSVLPWLLIISIVVVAGAFYYINFSTKSKQEVNIKTKTLPLESAERSSKIISNESVGLKFELPDGFKVVKETEEEYFKRANGDIRKNFTYYVQYSPAQMHESFYIILDSENDLEKANLAVWVFKNPQNLNPEKFYGEFWYYPFVWGDFTSAKDNIAPENIELIGGKEGKSGVVDYRDGKPKFIYLPLQDKNLMLQIQLPSEGNQKGKEILGSFKFE